VRRVLVCVLFLALAPMGWMASAPYEQVGFSWLAELTTDSTPVTTDTIPVTTETIPVTTDTLPVTTDTIPVTTDTIPVTTDTLPVTTDTLPVTTDTLPVTTDTTPVTTDTTPVTTDTTPVTTDTTPSTTASTTTTTVLGTTTSSSSEPSPPQPPQATTIASPSGTPPGSTVPPNVTNLGATVGDRSVKLTYQIPAGIDYVVIARSAGGGAGQVMYTGSATTYTDRGLTNGVEYRYVVVSTDEAGNRSAGVAIVVVPRKNLLRTPRDGARLTKVPKQFTWTRVPRASYYNFQLYSGGTLLFQSTAASTKKILSAFPTKPLYRFKSPWKWQGRKYKMGKGVYTWYVWPGYGPRANVRYGPLIGAATFQITK
jgi:hypothetical protein